MANADDEKTKRELIDSLTRYWPASMVEKLERGEFTTRLKTERFPTGQHDMLFVYAKRRGPEVVPEADDSDPTIHKQSKNNWRKLWKRLLKI